MPKQLYKITMFHGGLNNNSDARDIAENELSESTDIMVDEVGKIRTIGSNIAHVSSTPEDDQATGWTGTLIAGYGLLKFSHDRTGAEDAGNGGGSGEAETGDDYLAIYDGNDGQIWIYSKNEDAWDDDAASANNGPIDIGSSNTNTAQVSFYEVDGSLRVCDGNFSNSNTNKWYGYVKRSHFGSLVTGAAADAYDGWYSYDQGLSAPADGYVGVLSGTATSSGTNTNTVLESSTSIFTETIGSMSGLNYASSTHRIINKNENVFTNIVNRLADNQITTGDLGGGGDWESDAFVMVPGAGRGFFINIAASGSGGSIPAGDYQFGQTYLYDAEPGEFAAQESTIDVMLGGVVIASGEKITTNGIYYTSPTNSTRITGGRIYIRQYGTDEEWVLYCEVSLKNGVRINSARSYNAWEHIDDDVTATKVAVTATIGTISSLQSITYEALNQGLSPDASTVSAKWKTAVVANRTVYIGNVQYDGIVYGDAIFKSPAYKYVMFTKDGMLETSIRDGDSIIKLETYADRLLIFKKNKMELLNVSREIEFLEDTFANKGVSNNTSTCITDFGIAWVNEFGCYLYDGQKVHNLLEKEGRQIIKESTWATFISSPMIGYLPKKRQLIVVDDVSTAGSGFIYLYDLVTRSWTKGSSATFANQIKTNFITDWNGDLVHAHTNGTVVKWDDSSSTSAAVDIRTKDIDFQNPGQVKRIYKFYITHRGSASNIQLAYSIDGNAGTFTEAGSELSATSPTTDWTTTTIAPSSAFNCYSLVLKLFSDGTTPANFEINDITIVYRLKGQR